MNLTNQLDHQSLKQLSPVLGNFNTNMIPHLNGVNAVLVDVTSFDYRNAVQQNG